MQSRPSFWVRPTLACKSGHSRMDGRALPMSWISEHVKIGTFAHDIMVRNVLMRVERTTKISEDLLRGNR